MLRTRAHPAQSYHIHCGHLSRRWLSFCLCDKWTGRHTHGNPLTSASTEMSFTQSSICWGFVMAKLLTPLSNAPHKTTMEVEKGNWEITLESTLAPGFPLNQLCWWYYLSSAEGVGDMWRRGCTLLSSCSLLLHLCYQELLVSHNSPRMHIFLLEVMSRAVYCASF